MDQRVVGKYYWRLLHGLSHRYTPQRDAVRMALLLRSLKVLFPCKFCRRSYTAKLQHDHFAPHLASGRALRRWLIRLHNTVNREIERPRVTHDQALLLGQSFARSVRYNFEQVVFITLANIVRTHGPGTSMPMRTLARVLDHYPELTPPAISVSKGLVTCAPPALRKRIPKNSIVTR